MRGCLTLLTTHGSGVHPFVEESRLPKAHVPLPCVRQNVPYSLVLLQAQQALLGVWVSLTHPPGDGP